MTHKEQVVAEIDRRTDDLVQKIHVIEARFSHTRDRIEHAVSPRRQHEAHPWRSVGVGFAVGLAAGLIL